MTVQTPPTDRPLRSTLRKRPLLDDQRRQAIAEASDGELLSELTYRLLDRQRRLEDAAAKEAS